MGWDRAQSGPVIPGMPGSDKTLNGPIITHAGSTRSGARSNLVTIRTSRATERSLF